MLLQEVAHIDLLFERGGLYIDPAFAGGGPYIDLLFNQGRRPYRPAPATARLVARTHNARTPEHKGNKSQSTTQLTTAFVDLWHSQRHTILPDIDGLCGGAAATVGLRVVEPRSCL